MLGLYYAANACSMAAHIVLEESGEKYEPIRIDLTKGEQRSEAYLKLNPLGRVRIQGSNAAAARRPAGACRRTN